MARTKRNPPVSQPAPAIWRAALYMRLSREDGDKPESDSIANQRTLLESFAAQQPEMQVVGQYSDDGIILGTSQEVLAPQGFPDLVLIFIWLEITGP